MDGDASLQGNGQSKRTGNETALSEEASFLPLGHRLTTLIYRPVGLNAPNYPSYQLVGCAVPHAVFSAKGQETI